MAKIRQYSDIRCEFSNPDDDSCVFKLMTGNIDVPSGPGRWVLGCGCGSGKTTCIISLVAQRWQDGVTLCLPTINDANDMVQALVQHKVPESSILSLNSSDRTAVKTYMDNPTSIESFKVIIITHPRLWSDPLSHLTDGKKWLIIDELNLFVRPMAKVSKPAMSIFFHIDDVQGADGIPYFNSFCHINPSQRQLELYDLLLRGTECSFHSKNNALSVEKRQFTMKACSDYVRKLAEDGKLNEIAEYSVCNDLEDIRGMKVLMLDGTYDVLNITGNAKFTCIDTIKEKYCSPVHFEEFDMPFKRKIAMDSINGNNIHAILKPLVDKMADQVKSLNPGKSILFFTWMDAELNGKLSLKDGTDEYITPKGTAEMKLCDILKKELTIELNKRKTQDRSFSIQYRGSGYDKATNLFKDFAAVSFLGDWNGGKDAPSLIKKMYGGDCSYADYKVSLIIQAILRVRIRQHNGEPICVYYSSDFDRYVNGKHKEVRPMQMAYDYLERNSAKGMVTGMQVSPQIRKDIHMLKVYYPEIEEAIVNRKPLTMKISLREISSKLEKECRYRAYRQLIEHLWRTYGIELIIE